MDRADIVHDNFCRRLADGALPARRGSRSMAESGLSATQLVGLFKSQVTSRQLDRQSRKMQAAGQGFYTIGSSGHEGVAGVAHALRPTDPAFLHYRDGAFQVARASQVPGQSPIWDMLLSFACSSEDPISGGRHKVLGSLALNIPPQTSTIASHLPKAVGAAYGIGLAKRLSDCDPNYPHDAIAYCSFGDASLNHSTAQGAINTACWTAYQNAPMPILFGCEDNGIGISTATPSGWVAASVRSRPALRYFHADGLDLPDTVATVRAAADFVRRFRKPAFLHLRTVRLYGHAGADAQQAYMSREAIEAAEADDPLLHSARILMEEAGLSATDIRAIYDQTGAQVAHAASRAVERPRLSGAAGVMASIVPPSRAAKPGNGPDEATRRATFGPSDTRALAEPQHMAKLINFTLTDLMLEHGEIVLAGEDIGPKGGVYGVTQRLSDRFGPDRVINTLLDEQSILGLSIGLAQNNILPIPEIQFLAYLHNAEDQLRGEAATLPFFSNGQFTNPMVVRIAGLGYQRGFGGHFHNDNSLAVLRDIPGIIIGCPSNGRDAALMLREAVRLAREENRVVVMVEPIARYMTRDLLAEGDGGWTFPYPQHGESAPLDQVAIHGDGTDLAIVTYGNGAYLSRQAQVDLAEKGVAARVVDLRWLAPQPDDAIIAATGQCTRVLIVDECRRTGSQSEALMALFTEAGRGGDSARLAAEDSFIATGPAYGATLPSRDGIVAAARKLMDMAP